MIINGQDILKAIEAIQKKNNSSGEYEDIFKYLKFNRDTDIIEKDEYTDEYHDLINKTKVERVIRIHRDYSFQDYYIKKDMYGEYSLINKYTSAEWGLFEETPDKLIELLRHDVKEGRCDKFEVILEEK